MKRGIICQACGKEAPCAYAEFHYNIGMLVMRRHMQINGIMCKRCIHKNFWKFTLKDITLGWWGYISLLMTPIFLVMNIVRYIAVLSLPATPPDAKPPQLTTDAIDKLERVRRTLIDRLNAKEPLVDVANAMAPTVGVTPGQIVLYVRALSKPPSMPAPAPNAAPAPMAAPLANASRAGNASPAPLPPPISVAAPAPINAFVQAELEEEEPIPVETEADVQRGLGV